MRCNLRFNELLRLKQRSIIYTVFLFAASRGELNPLVGLNMIKLSKKVEYGLISLLHIASLEKDKLITSREIAHRYHIPSKILGKVLQALAKSELIESIQGVKGGYRLNRELDTIVFGEVIEALEGPIHLTPCTCEDYICFQEPVCNIKEPVFHLQDQLMKFIYGLSLDSLQNKHHTTVSKPVKK